MYVRCASTKVTYASEILSRTTTFYAFGKLGNDAYSECSFKVFERVWWWSFRVSTPFSLLCLVLLTDFHKHASFRSNILNYLTMTFTLGKQTKDNVINRKFQCWPAHSLNHSFIFIPGFPLRRVAGENTSRSRTISDCSIFSDLRLNNRLFIVQSSPIVHCSDCSLFNLLRLRLFNLLRSPIEQNNLRSPIEQSPNNLRLFCSLHTKTGPSKARDVVTSRGPWTNSGPLSPLGCRL